MIGMLPLPAAEIVGKIEANLALLWSDGGVSDDTTVAEAMESNEPIGSYLIGIGAMVDTSANDGMENRGFQITPLGHVLIELLRDKQPWMQEFMEGMAGI